MGGAWLLRDSESSFSSIFGVHASPAFCETLFVMTSLTFSLLDEDTSLFLYYEQEESIIMYSNI